MSRKFELPEDGVDLDAQLQFIEAKTGEQVACPFCGNGEWLFQARPPARPNTGVQPTYIPLSPVLHETPGIVPSIPAIAIICTSCGFIRLHHVEYLSQVMKKGAPE